MAENNYYCVFQTPLGFAGLCGTAKRLKRSCICKADYRTAKKYLLVGMENTAYKPDYMKSVKDRINRFFIGSRADFSDIAVSLDGLNSFSMEVLTALRRVNIGSTVSYGQLADMAGSPKAGRAVGTILKNNPLPLIIPCHRVVKATGSLGNFMGNQPGGNIFKRKLLQLEGYFTS